MYFIAGVDGQTLTMKHKDGETKIVVPPDVPVVTYEKGDKDDLKAGTKIFIAAGHRARRLDQPVMDIGDVEPCTRHALEDRNQDHRQEREGDDRLQPAAQGPAGLAPRVTHAVIWDAFFRRADRSGQG